MGSRSRAEFRCSYTFALTSSLDEQVDPFPITSETNSGMSDSNIRYSWTTGLDPPSLTQRDRRDSTGDIELTSLDPAIDGLSHQRPMHDRTPSLTGIFLDTIQSIGLTQRSAQEDSPPLSYPQGSQQSKRPSTIRRLVLDTWTCEATAVSFSIACLIATAITIRLYDGKPIPQLPSGLTLNTVVSVLSTAARSGMGFAVSASLAQMKWVWIKGAR